MPLAGDGPRLLYVVSEDWYFISHRLHMARAAKSAGFDVHVACNTDRGGDAIAREGFTLHPIDFPRGRLSPVAAFKAVRQLRAIHSEIRPAIVHQVALQSSVLGSLAAIGRPAACINALTGFGFVFSSQNIKATMMRPALRTLLRWLLRRKQAIALVQNPDDSAVLQSIGISGEKITMIQGSGVDTVRLRPTPEPQGPVTVAFVGRLLDDKGVRTLVSAQGLLNERGAGNRLLIAGTPDTANPTSVSEAEAESWNYKAGISWLGHTSDIADLWARSHIAVLPSRREGLPLSLLEAAACGRPMIATDVPGCREIVVANETGLLVPVDDATALAIAIDTLVQSKELRARYGAAARQRVEQRFSATIIAQKIVDLYRSLLNSAKTV